MNDNTLRGRLTARGNLNATVNTIVYAHNYNDLSNKPKINNVTLQGNKTASDLGLVTPSDIPVTSVNEQTGDVELTGDNINYDLNTSVNAKINDLESQIITSGVHSVNGQTGTVILTGANIDYSAGVSLSAKIDAVEGEIPVINYPVTSVNGMTGAVVLSGSDIEYSEGVSISDQIDNVSGEIGDLTASDIPMSSVDPTTTASAIGTNTTAISTINDNIGDLSTLTTTNKDSLVDAVNEVNGYKSGDTITLTNYFTPCVYDANRLRAIINLPKGVRACSFACSYLEVYINSTDSVQTNNITNTEVQTRTPNQLWVQFTGNFTNVSNNNAGIAVISGTITFT